MLQLLTGATSSGAGASFSLSIHGQHNYTVFAVPSTDYTGSARVSIQAATSTNGPWSASILASDLTLSDPALSDVRNIAEGTYVAMRAFVQTAPTTGNLSVVLFGE